MTFAGQIRSVSMYLRHAELIPLYATEWIILAAVGICICGATVALDAACKKLRPGVQAGAVSRAVFAMIVVAAAILGTQIWIASFGYGALSLPEWHTLLVGLVLLAAIAAGWRHCRETLSRLAWLGRPIALLGGLTLVSATFVSGALRTESAAPKNTPSRGIDHPNIVLISIDALSADHLVSFGGTRPTSPNIDALAAQSIVFERFHATSNFTTPGVASLLTGELPWEHRAFQLLARPTMVSIADSLPARLHAAGYSTAYFSSNPWAGGRREGFSAYFDYRDSDLEWDTAPCFDVLANRLPYLCAASSNPLISLLFKSAVRAAAEVGLLDPAGYADPARLVAAEELWTARHGNAPVFVWAHFLPPHDPYAAPAPWLGRFDPSSVANTAGSSHPEYLFESKFDSARRIAALKARYDESVSYVDHYVGRLIEIVRANLGPNTAIILTADHGESFSHGYGGHGGLMLYEDLLHIPLIISLPGESSAERRFDLAIQSDIAPTIAAIAQISASPAWSGVSLLERPSGVVGRTIFAMDFEQNRSLGRLSTGSVAALNDRWKLVRFIGKPQYPHMPPLETQLFDLANDPGEQQNVATTHGDVVAALSSQIDEQLARFGNAVIE
jgi:arylsulfatase A-like enzyme